MVRRHCLHRWAWWDNKGHQLLAAAGLPASHDQCQQACCCVLPGLHKAQLQLIHVLTKG